MQPREILDEIGKVVGFSGQKRQLTFCENHDKSLILHTSLELEPVGSPLAANQNSPTMIRFWNSACLQDTDIYTDTADTHIFGLVWSLIFSLIGMPFPNLLH